MHRVPAPAAQSSEDPAVLTARLLLRISYFGLAIAVPVTAAFWHGAAFILLPFGAVMLLISAALDRPSGTGRRAREIAAAPVTAAIALLVIWTCLSLFWTPFPGNAFQQLFKVGGSVALMAAAIFVLPERSRPPTLYLLPIGVAIAAALTILLSFNTGQRLSGGVEGNHFTVARGVLSLVVLVWPALGALATRDRWTSLYGLAVAVAVATLAARSTFGGLALSVGALAYGCARLDVRRTTIVLAALGALLLIFGPLVPFALKACLVAVHGGVPPSLTPVSVWADIVYGHRARLITGHGLDSMSRSRDLGYLPEDIPRTLLFQIWYELGAVGAVALAFIAARTFLNVVRAPAGVAPFLVAGLAANATLACLDHNIDQLWWMTLLCIAALFHVTVLRGQYRTKRPTVRPTL